MVQVFADAAAMRAFSRNARAAGKRIALVPTMVGSVQPQTPDRHP